MRSFPRLRASHAAARLQPPTSSHHFHSSRPLVTLTSPTHNHPPQHRHYHHQTLSSRPTLRLLPRHAFQPKTLFNNNQPAHRRPFSLTSTLVPAIETSVSAAHTALTTLHAVSGTPWCLTITLFAVGLTLLVRVPTTVYSRRVSVRRQALVAPVEKAWEAVRARAVARGIKGGGGGAGKAGEAQGKGRGEGKGGREGLQLRLVEIVKAGRKATKARNRRMGVQMWKHWAPAVTAFPLWLTGIEALRRMCGGPRGLLGTLIFGAKTVEGADAGAGEGVAVATGGAAAVDVGGGLGLASPSSSLPAATEQAEGLREAVTNSAYAAVDGADMSMATGGCLWFPDLMVADPHHILPFALSAILVLNMLPMSKTYLRLLLGLNKELEMEPRDKWRLRVRRFFITLAMFVGPITMDLPAALHLYWISSALLTSVSTRIIAWAMPLPKAVAPAKNSESPFVIPRHTEVKRL